MATVLSGNRVKLENGSVVTAQTGGWYDGQQFWGGTLSNPGQINTQSNQQGAGQQVSNEVIAQTNPNNVSYIQDRIEASQLSQPTNVGLPSTSQTESSVASQESEAKRLQAELDAEYARKEQEYEKQYNTLKQKEDTILEQNVKPLTAPFREQLENTERERLYVNQNFEANQALVNELDSLLTEGNNLIKQAQNVTGLAAIRNPRIQQTMDDVAARAGVIEAVINARNGQIAVAENMIDRSINAIAADRNDQISYYETILNLNRQDMINLDTKQSKMIEARLDLKKNELTRAQDSADYIKNLLVNPQTAGLMGEAGVKLTDSVQTINAKLSNAQTNREVREMTNAMTTGGYVEVYNPTKAEQANLTVLTDAKGKKHYYKKQGGLNGGQTAEDFISRQLGIDQGSGGYDNVSLSSAEYNVVESAINEVLAPTMSPSSGIGTVYYDSYGRKWVFERSGWRLVG